MTEIIAAYITTIHAEDVPGHYTCPRCNTVIGRYQPMPNGLICLAIGPVVLVAANGLCSACGAPWFFTTTDRQLTNLIERTRRFRSAKAIDTEDKND